MIQDSDSPLSSELDWLDAQSNHTPPRWEWDPASEETSLATAADACLEFSFSVIFSHDMRLGLKKPLTARLTREDGLWFCETRWLAISGYGPTMQLAIHDFMDDFWETHDSLTREANDSLTSDAQDLRDRIVDLIQYASSARALSSSAVSREEDALFTSVA